MNAPPKISPRPTAALINVHIDTLVVEGLAVRNADHLGAMVQQQLQNLIAENGLGHLSKAADVGEGGSAFKTLRAPAFHTSRSPHAADAGEKIARAIYGGLRT